MNYKCLHCGANLEYNIDSRDLYCSHCSSHFPISDFEYTSCNNDSESETFRMKAGSSGLLSMQLCKCKSCGGELFKTSTETSTFCAYCGQSSLITERIEDCYAPDLIIPFKVSKSDAERIIRANFEDNKYAPSGIRNFKTETLHGIYVPFMVYDADYSDRITWKYYLTDSDGWDKSHCWLRDFDCHFENVTRVASKRVSKSAAERLEPFDMRQAVEFNPAYLSGFYSDMTDVSTLTTDMDVKTRLNIIAENCAVKDLKHVTKSVRIEKSNPKINITKKKYALLPVWFLTFRFEDTPYTILLNGQTGKIVGGIPFDKKHLFKTTALLSLPISAAIAFPAYFIGSAFTTTLQNAGSVKFLVIAATAMAVIISLGIGCGNAKSFIQSSREITNSSEINSFAKERQE